MIAVDTNVIVRLLVDNSPEKMMAARNLLDDGTLWIAKTVLLETEWVLRSAYGFSDQSIQQAFIRLLGYPNVHFEAQDEVVTAMSPALQGIDFADALHFCSTQAGIEFVTFDRDFVRRARRAGLKTISELTSRR